VLPPLTLLEVVSVKAPGEWEYLPGMRINQPLITVRITIRGLYRDGHTESTTYQEHESDEEHQHRSKGESKGISDSLDYFDDEERSRDGQGKVAQKLALSVPSSVVREAPGGIEMYRALLKMALADGGLAAAENALLEESRERYGISWEQHHHLLNEVTDGGTVRFFDEDAEQGEIEAFDVERCTEEDCDEEITLAEWLEEMKLSVLLKPMQDFGADTVDDLRDLEEEDLQEIEKGLKKLQIKRFRRGLRDNLAPVVGPAAAESPAPADNLAPAVSPTLHPELSFVSSTSPIHARAKAYLRAAGDEVSVTEDGGEEGKEEGKEGGKENGKEGGKEDLMTKISRLKLAAKIQVKDKEDQDE
jgi:hypothetical protein